MHNNWDILTKTQADALFEEWTFNRLTLSGLDLKNELSRRLELIDPGLNGELVHPIENYQVNDYLRDRFVTRGELGVRDYLVDQFSLADGGFYFVYKPLPELQLFDDASVITTSNSDLDGWQDAVSISPFETSDASLDSWMALESPETSLAVAELANIVEGIKNKKDEKDDNVEKFDDDDIIIHA